MKNTKKALLTSALCLLLCCSMLIGTTFAWFTDTVTTNKNVITGGNLDIELYYKVEGMSDWAEVDSDTNVFMDGALWEPGHTEVVKLKVVNAGALALQYHLGVNVYQEETGINVNGDEFKLSDYIKFGVVDGEQTYDRDQAVAAVNATASALNRAYDKADVLLETGKEHVVTMVVYMPETVGNEANYMTGTAAPKIYLGINLFATQQVKENDSFGPGYDQDAVYPENMWVGAASYDWYLNATGDTYELATPADLAGFANLANGTAPANMARGGEFLPADNFKGKTVKLTANMDMGGVLWTPISNFAGTFDGQNYSIANLHIVGTSSVGFFKTISSVATVKDVKFEQAKVYGNHYVGILIGWESNENANATISGIEVIDSLVVCEPELINGAWDNGDKAGAIVGYAVSLNITDCDVKNTTVKAYRDFGGIVGYAHKKMVVTGNTVENLNLVIDNSHNYKNYATDAEHDANMIVGEANANAVIADNTCMIGDVETSIIYTVEDLAAALTNGGNYVLNNDIATTATITAPSGVNTVLYLEGKTISGTFDGTGNRDMFLVKGNLTVYNGNVTMEATVNQGWNAMADIFDITAGGSVKLENVTAAVSGTDMNFIAHLNNWGSASLYVDNCDFTTTYVAVRAFNTGYDMNNITIKNTDFHGGRMFWVHNYTAEGKDDSTLNLDIYGNNNTSDNEKPVRYGFSNALYYTIEGALLTAKVENVDNLLISGGDVTLDGDLNFNSSETTANSGYGATGVSVKGGILDGNGHSLGINNWGTWDAAVHTTGGTIKNLKINSGMRGIFMGSANADVYIDNVIIDGTIYTFNSDGGSKDYGVYISNSTLNGWTSFSDVHKEVIFTNCNFGEGQGYAFCRPYNAAEFIGCVFEEGFEIEAIGTVVLEGCYYGDTLITAENIDSLNLIVGGADKVTVK